MLKMNKQRITHTHTLLAVGGNEGRSHAKRTKSKQQKQQQQQQQQQQSAAHLWR
jgi:hypothetical protein